MPKEIAITTPQEFRDSNTDVLWLSEFDDRELDEILFAEHYTTHFDHGTSGHLAYKVIAKLFRGYMNQTHDHNV